MSELEVYFDDYCPICKHHCKIILEPPCNKCQAEPTRPDSHKPVCFEEDKELTRYLQSL